MFHYNLLVCKLPMGVCACANRMCQSLVTRLAVELLEWLCCLECSICYNGRLLHLTLIPNKWRIPLLVYELQTFNLTMKAEIDALLCTIEIRKSNTYLFILSDFFLQFTDVFSHIINCSTWLHIVHNRDQTVYRKHLYLKSCNQAWRKMC